VLPSLAIPEKKAVVIQLLRPRPTMRRSTPACWRKPVRELLAAAESSAPADTLIVQGFVLERLGQIIYKVLQNHNAGQSGHARHGLDRLARLHLGH